ncbi:MAG: endo alpha-1,4 polygalactosaminidase [Planctomycetota bacterium]|nr:endo alpha-1,4 polygalactosaminidase [Planctomycetota bacterium]
MQLHSYGRKTAVRCAAAAMLVSLWADSGCAPLPSGRLRATARQRACRAQRWLCYYGTDRAVLTLPGYELLILDADALGRISAEERRGRVCLAYLSIGEVNTQSHLWPQVKERSWLASANPHWPEARRVDVRSPEWHDILLRQEATRLLAAGYDGLFLDTVDSYQALLAEDAERYRGSREATAEIIRGLRRAFPEAVLIMNGGFDLLPEVAKHIDAVLYEGLRSTYDFASRAYRRRRAEEIAWLDAMAARVRNHGLPLFALEYAAAGDASAAKALSEEVRRLGCRPFVAQIELDKLPGKQP